MPPSHLRRSQRQHSLACWRRGAQQRIAHNRECCIYDELVSSEEAIQLIHSVAIHRSDGAVLPVWPHYAHDANCLATQAGHKSKRTFKEHRLAHQAANGIKHGNSNVLMPPPAPPPIADVEAIEHRVLEKELLHKAFASVDLNSMGVLEVAMMKRGCPDETPRTAWNTNAEPFVPFAGTAFNLASEAHNSTPFVDFFVETCQRTPMTLQLDEVLNFLQEEVSQPAIGAESGECRKTPAARDNTNCEHFSIAEGSSSCDLDAPSWEDAESDAESDTLMKTNFNAMVWQIVGHKLLVHHKAARHDLVIKINVFKSWMLQAQQARVDKIAANGEKAYMVEETETQSWWNLSHSSEGGEAANNRTFVAIMCSWLWMLVQVLAVQSARCFTIAATCRRFSWRYCCIRLISFGQSLGGAWRLLQAWHNMSCLQLAIWHKCAATRSSLFDFVTRAASCRNARAVCTSTIAIFHRMCRIAPLSRCVVAQSFTWCIALVKDALWLIAKAIVLAYCLIVWLAGIHGVEYLYFQYRVQCWTLVQLMYTHLNDLLVGFVICASLAIWLLVLRKCCGDDEDQEQHSSDGFVDYNPVIDVAKPRVVTARMRKLLNG